MQKVDILQIGNFLSDAQKKLEENFNLHSMGEGEDKARFLKEAGPKIVGIAAGSGRPAISAEVMGNLPNLKIVAGFGVGYDDIDVAHAANHGVTVTNTPGVLDEEVADTALSLLLATTRRIPQADRFLRSGKWLEESFPLTPTLRDRKAGIVGLGRIGKAIARRLQAFGVSISYHGRNRQTGVEFPYYQSIRELAEAVDILIMIIPGGKETYHTVNADVLRALGPDGILINVARGTVVDEAALVEALRSNIILAAGLDVFEKEPQVPEELIALDNVVLTPHVGSATLHTRNAMGNLVVDNLTAFFSGKAPITPVPETPWRG